MGKDEKQMEWSKQQVKSILLVVCGGVALYTLLHHLGVVAAGFRWLVDILKPFLLGGTLAFILNVPMRAIERHLYPNSRKWTKTRRPLALVLAILAVIGVIALAGGVIGTGYGFFLRRRA